MNIIVAGCGKIGKAVIATLCSEGHDVTLLDKNADLINEMTNIYDVIGVCGNCADCETLEEAAIDKAELFICVTGSDEMNMLSCFIAKKMGAKHTVARIRNPEYNDRSLGFMRQQLDLSMSINPELLVAQELYNILKLPSAFKVEYFSRRNLEMIEVKLKNDSPLCGKKLSKLREKQNVEFLIGAVLRGDRVIIPDGSFELAAGDEISIAAAPADMQKLLKGLGILKKQARSVMILGGSKTAYYLSKMLLASGNEVKIIEKDTARCEQLSELLPKAVLIGGDGSQQELLLEEGLRSLDAFVALTGMDEENILISIFASNQNVPKVISKVNRDEMAKMAENLGLDCIVSTKSITSDIILRYTRALNNSLGSSIETLYKIMNGKVEALEFKVLNDSKLLGVPIKDLTIKPGILIAGIIRAGKKTIIPKGDDVILQGDRVIILSAEYRISNLADILR
ncbi:MAG: Trk system potassium transporter TrkA [Clostridia bacterium]|nr:Trk system potassium transporter TrkA [Clostridia bacterium]